MQPFAFKKKAGLWIGELDRSLGWTMQQYQRFMPLLHVSSFEELHERWPPLDPTFVVTSSRNRAQDVERDADRAKQRFKNAIHRTVLGENWLGHRRTQPISEECTTNYWFEAYQKMLPYFAYQLMNQRKKQGSPKPNASKDKFRHQTILSDLAVTEEVFRKLSIRLIALVSPRRDFHDLFSAKSEAAGVISIGCRNIEEIPHAKFDGLILDASPYLTSTPDIDTQLERLSLPTVVIDGFPNVDRWENWAKYSIPLQSPGNGTVAFGWLDWLAQRSVEQNDDFSQCSLASCK